MRITLFALILMSLTSGLSETFVFPGGGSIKGELIKEKPDTYVVDVGFNVILIPKSKVLEVQQDGLSKEVVDAQADDFSGLYRAAEQGATYTVEELVKSVGEAVVEVRTRSGLGSGFMIHPDGYLVTNHHVISGDTKLVVTIFRQAGGTLSKVQYQDVRIIAMDPFRDLALLKIEAKEADDDFAYVPIGNSDELTQGQTVFAVGSPLGFSRTVSKGIVSLPARVMGAGMMLIQTTTQINPGNSGGPLFNLRGQVVGVNNMKIATVGVEGVGFAIPSSVMKLFLNKRDAFTFDPRNPNAGYRYIQPPPKRAPSDSASEQSSPNKP